jgi:hypothetical protein
MLIEAMKSAGPKTSVSRRLDEPPMASTLTSPLALSIWASMPMRPTSSPFAFSIWVSSVSSQTTWVGSSTLGSIRQSRNSPAPSTTSMTSR